MSVILSDRQKDDLHKAMLDYLFSAGFTKAFEGLKEELPNFADHQPDVNAQSSGLLVKKWSSVIRMQKKILDLDQRLQQALEDNARSPGSSSSKKYDEDWTPKAHSAKHVLTGHRDRVNAISFHPRYSVIASAGEDAMLKVRDWETGELERTLKGHTMAIKDCEFDSKGMKLVSGGQDTFVKLWNVEEDYQNFATLRGHENRVLSCRFLPDDLHVASAAADHTMRIWEISSTHCVKVFRPHDSAICGATPSVDGRFILTCSHDHNARILDAESGAVKVDLRDHDSVVESAVFVPPFAIDSIRQLVEFTPPGGESAKGNAALHVALVMTASRDKTVKLWDALRGICLWTFRGHDDWVQSIAFHPSGKYMLTAGDDSTLRIWELGTGRCARTIFAHDDKKFVSCLAWGRMPIASSAGASTTSGAGGAGKGGGTKVNGTTKGKEGESAVVRPVNVIATGSWDKTIKIWLP